MAEILPIPHDRQVPARRILALVILAFSTVGVEYLLGLAVNLGSSDLEDNPGRWAWFVDHPFLAGGVLAVATVIGIFLWRSVDAPAPETDVAAAVDAAAETLAVRLRESWSEEASLRLVDRPASLPVAWDDGAGSTGTIDDIEFDRTGRLVVLGGRGAGKTVLAIRFLLDRLPGPRETLAGGPVPVLVNLSTWDPRSVPYQRWLEDELVSAFPGLGRTAPDSDWRMARELLARGRILPVLDGLDEMAGELRAEALGVLARSLRGPDQFLLTSRAAEYRAAVRTAGALPGTRVIVLQDLAADDLTDYLGGGDWAEVIDKPELRTPLMAYLARKVAESGRVTPGDVAALGDAAAIRDRLMREFVPAVYGDGNPRAQRCLRYLARYLVATNSSHLRWWELSRGLTRRDRAWLGFGFGLICASVTSWLEMPFGAETATFDGVALGIAAGILAAMTIGRGSVLGRRLSPLPVRIGGGRRGDRAVDRYDGRGARRFALRIGALVGAASGAVWAPTLGIGDPLGGILNGLVVMSATGVPVGLAAWFATRLSQRIEEPVSLGQAVGPASLLRLDRAATWTEAALYGAAAAIFGSVLYPLISLPLSTGIDLVNGPSVTLSMPDADEVLRILALPAAETAIIVVFIFPFLLSAWGRFVLVRAYLVYFRRMPPRLMDFLADAHRRGVLRQAGPVYQFRHIEIRDALARE
jgi:hypothetical protein